MYILSCVYKISKDPKAERLMGNLLKIGNKTKSNIKTNEYNTFSTECKYKLFSTLYESSYQTAWIHIPYVTLKNNFSWNSIWSLKKWTKCKETQIFFIDQCAFFQFFFFFNFILLVSINHTLYLSKAKLCRQRVLLN